MEHTMSNPLPRPLLCLALASLPASLLPAGCGEGAAPPAAPPATSLPSAAEPSGEPSPPIEAEADPPATPPVDEGRTGEQVEKSDPDALWGQLLDELVTDAGLVRYDLLADDVRVGRLGQVVSGYAAASLPAEKDGRIAFWSNAYNANVMLTAFQASRRPAFESVVKEQGFFDARTITVAGETLTLNDLENERIRPLGDPRIHAALVCAAVSCPPLRSEAYTAERLDEQLNDQCKRWVNDPTKFRMDEGRLGASEILKWYGADFDIPRYGSAVGFILAYSDPAGDLARYIVGAEKPQVTWLEYDWSLNAAR
jgi:hypothetical protein